VARNWGSTDPGGGFRHANFRDKAMSYTIGLHASFERPEFILAGDRNFGYDAIASSCWTGIVPVRQINPSFTVAGWQNDLHGTNGNLLLNDGRVKQVDTAGFRTALRNQPSQGNLNEHFLAPQ
jgi:hypothetical protein